MKTKMLMLGMVVGLVAALCMGSVIQATKLIVEGSVGTVTNAIFESTLSGMDSHGRAYLAITDKRTGDTNLFLLQQDDVGFGKNALQRGKEGRVIAVPQ